MPLNLGVRNFHSSHCINDFHEATTTQVSCVKQAGLHQIVMIHVNTYWASCEVLGINLKVKVMFVTLKEAHELFSLAN